MLGRAVSALIMATTFATAASAAPAVPQARIHQISISAGPLSFALRQLAGETGTDLLFDEVLVRGHQVPALQGRMTVDAALERLLAGLDLGVRRTSGGAYLIVRQRQRALPPAPPAAPPDEPPVPEILVIGTRTHNADIRRRESDIQPYKVTSKRDLLDAHRDTLDDFFRSRITADTAAAPAILGTSGDTRSSINLRGLGPSETLVLVDGRRMPSIGIGATDAQADVNGIPISGVKRIETLTGTAGGIYGFGALGGVVNVVLDHDLRGLELRFSQGVTSRGDAYRNVLDARWGLASRDGRTDVDISVGATSSRPMLVGKRNYLLRDRESTNVTWPDYVRSLKSHGNGTAIFGLSPGPLTFKPEYGGGTVAGGYTYLPAGFVGNAGQLADALARHGGQLSLGTWPGEADSSLGSWRPWSASLLINARHRFGSDVEAYFDALVLSNRGENRDGTAGGELLVLPSSPADPFTQAITLTFPVAGLGSSTSTRYDTRRYTIGLISGLPHRWRGTLEATLGSIRNKASASGAFFYAPFVLSGEPDAPPLNPFADWQSFQEVASTHDFRFKGTSSLRDFFQEQSARIAGPLFSAPGGPATLTLLADRFAERIPASTFTSVVEEGDTSSTSRMTSPPLSTSTLSLYAEFRSRLFPADAPFPLLRGLELQLAARRDRRVDRFADTLEPSRRVRTNFSGTAYTAGAKLSPTRWLTLRGSVATGELPPTRDNLSETQFSSSPAAVNDPKRGGSVFNFEDRFVEKTGGKAALKSVEARTTALGAVLLPSGEEGLRVSADYSHIRRRRDVISFSENTILAHEDSWPDRVVRAPLTDEDRAKGYSAGKILELDDRAANAGSLDVKTIDTRLDWPMPLFGGRLRLRADATYYLRNRAAGLFQPTVEHVGYAASPLRWRANGGPEWSRRGLTLGANVQYFGHYRPYAPADKNGALTPADAVRLQGSGHVLAQTYVDCYLSWRISERIVRFADGLTVDFGVVNVFDHAPPRETMFLSPATEGAQGYSKYGDPRRRRFEFALTGKF